MAELPTILKALGEHLYIKIEHLTQAQSIETDIAKLTGILLETGEKEVLKMLQSDQYLQQCMLQARIHVPYISHSPQEQNAFAEREHNFQDAEDLEETLYEEVKKLEPDLSGKITGMILEMELSQVKTLLSSSSHLKAAVRKAKETYLSHSKKISESTSDCTRDECCSHGLADEELGEIIYEEAEKLSAAHAEKLTGMVIELDSKQLKSLAQDSLKLQEVLRMAYATLQQTS